MNSPDPEYIPLRTAEMLTYNDFEASLLSDRIDILTPAPQPSRLTNSLRLLWGLGLCLIGGGILWSLLIAMSTAFAQQAAFVQYVANEKASEHSILRPKQLNFY
jgi:hypothetical protein